MHIAHANTLIIHIFGQVFGHLFRQRRDQRAIAFGCRLADFVDDIIDLVAAVLGDRTNFYGRIDQACRADDLFDEHATGAFHFPIRGRRGHMYGLGPHRVPFFEF